MLPAQHVTSTPATSSSSGGRLVSVDGRTLPLRHAHLEARAEGGLARTVLTQRFVNPHAEPLHVTYLLPLPSDGAVSGFAFTLGEVRIVGEVDTRHRARERFETALAQGRTAAILEQDRSSLFTQEVGNIPPGAEVVAEIVIDQKLRWLEEGAWEFRFPTVVAPRYQGAPGRVGDSAKLEVPVSTQDVGARSSLAFVIADAMRGPIESVSHRVTSNTEDDETQVRFEEARLDRDVVVRWPVSTDEVGASIALARPTDARHEGKAYGLLSLIPPKAPKRSMPRDLTLLLDTSGSMGGRPLDQLKRVAKALIETLGERDRLEMIEFSSRPSRFRNEPIAASADGKKAARRWIDNLRAGGGTEMHTAVLESLRSLRPQAQRQVILMTDGYIGFEREIIDTLMTKLPPNVRLHTVGVGSSPNRSLTEPAARAGRGVELIVGLQEDPDRAVHRLTVRTSQPLVTEVRLSGSALIESAPQQMPDLFAGCPALISVALQSNGGELQVEGISAEGVFAHRLTIPALTLGSGPQGVTARFGREKVEDLEMELSAGTDWQEIDRNIESVGLAFQIATRLTSWIAATEKATVDPATASRKEAMPHELADGLSIEGLGLRGSGAADGGVEKLGAVLAGSVGDEIAELEEEMDDEAMDTSVLYSLRELPFVDEEPSANEEPRPASVPPAAQTASGGHVPRDKETKKQSRTRRKRDESRAATPPASIPKPSPQKEPAKKRKLADRPKSRGFFKGLFGKGKKPDEAPEVTQVEEPTEGGKRVTIDGPITVRELAIRLGESAHDVWHALEDEMGLSALSLDSWLDADIAASAARARGFEVNRVRALKLGSAKVSHITFEGTATVAHCQVDDGKLVRTAKVVLRRGDTIVWVGSFRRLHEAGSAVDSVTKWVDCSVQLEGWGDLEPGDVIECFA